MKRRYSGDCLGEKDADGIAQWYPNCKVRFDGSHYIATPHTTNRTRHTKHKEKEITVSVRDGKLALEEDATTLTPDEAYEKSPTARADESEREVAVKRTTCKQIFDELYEKYLDQKPKARKQAIYKDMQPLFKSEEELQLFVDNHWYRRWRNLVVRRQRFARKAYNQKFQYFATFTYSDEKHTEESFQKRLLQTLRRLATRHNWRYMGVWERGKETNRLHFHALVYIPDGEMVGSFEEVTDYNKKTGRQKTVTQNTFFADKFGRNEFDIVGGTDRLYGKAIAYIMKYMEKQNTKAVYSRGLYEYFHSDIMGEDVVGKMEITNETDNRLLLSPKFKCWDEGVFVGEVSEETIKKLPKSV